MLIIHENLWICDVWTGIIKKFANLREQNEIKNLRICYLRTFKKVYYSLLRADALHCKYRRMHWYIFPDNLLLSKSFSKLWLPHPQKETSWDPRLPVDKSAPLWGERRLPNVQGSCNFSAVISCVSSRKLFFPSLQFQENHPQNNAIIHESFTKKILKVYKYSRGNKSYTKLNVQ